MHFNNTTEIRVVYDDPQKEDQYYLLQDNMWTDYMLSCIVNYANTYGWLFNMVDSGVGYMYGADGSNMKMQDTIVLSNYDMTHATSATSILGTTYAKACSVDGYSYLPGLPGTIAFTPTQSTTMMITGGYPCIMSMASSTDSTCRNMWVEGFSWSWDGEIFYVGKTYAVSSFANATIGSGTSSFDVYSTTGFRKGHQIRIYKSDNHSGHRLTNISSNTFTIEGTTNTQYAKGSTVSVDCALIYTNKSTLASSTITGATTIPVSDVADFAVNQFGMIDDETNWEGFYINSIAVSGASGILTITGGGLTAAYSNTNSTVYGSFKNAHSPSTNVDARDWYSWRYHATTFSTAEGTAFGSTPIRTIGLKYSGLANPYVIILLPYGIYKDSGSYSSTLYIQYKYMVASRYLS